jgi:hypothetical protein
MNVYRNNMGWDCFYKVKKISEGGGVNDCGV